MRTRRIWRDSELISNVLRLYVTEKPRPPDPRQLTARSVAAGQWTDIRPTIWYDEFEMDRADQVEFEFSQRGHAFVVAGTRWLRQHVEVPSALRPGMTRVRVRTYYKGEPSQWSKLFRLAIAPTDVPPLIDDVSVKGGASIWSRWRRRNDLATVGSGDSLVVQGQVSGSGRNLSQGLPVIE